MSLLGWLQCRAWCRLAWSAVALASVDGNFDGAGGQREGPLGPPGEGVLRCHHARLGRGAEQEHAHPPLVVARPWACASCPTPPAQDLFQLVPPDAASLVPVSPVGLCCATERARYLVERRGSRCPRCLAELRGPRRSGLTDRAWNTAPGYRGYGGATAVSRGRPPDDPAGRSRKGHST